MVDLSRTLRGAFPGPGIEPDATTRARLALLGANPVHYGAMTPATLPTPPDYAVTVDPSSLTFTIGDEPTFDVGIVPSDGFADPIHLAIDDPTGIEADLKEADISSPYPDTTFSLASLTPGSYVVTAWGFSGRKERSATLDVTVTFSPSGLPGLALWLKADAIGGLSDGDPVATWADSSGNGRDVTQATAANKPLYKVNIVNGKPVVRFDGSNDRLVSTTFPQISGDLSVFAVASTKRLGTWPTIVSHSGTTYESGWLMYLSLADFQPAFSAKTPGGIWGTNFAIDPDSNGVAADTFVVLTGQRIGPATTVGWNGRLTTDDGLAESTDYDTSPELHIGAKNAAPGVQNFLNGDVAEVLIYSGTLTPTQRQQVEQYLAAKYGIALF